MNDQQRFTNKGSPVSTYEYDDAIVFVMDVGAGTDASIDVVDGTAMFAVADKQYDIDLPTGDAQAFMKNGIVGVEVER